MKGRDLADDDVSRGEKLGDVDKSGKLSDVSRAEERDNDADEANDDVALRSVEKCGVAANGRG